MGGQKLGFAENFLLSGTAAALAKTSAAPIERIKLLVQNQGELIKQGRLEKGYTSIVECFTRTLRNEGAISFWRGNLASVLRYFPQQALNFAFKDEIQKVFKPGRNPSYKEKFSKNILSGGCAGSLSLVFVQSIDYTRTRLAVDAKNGGSRQFNGIIDVYLQTIKSDGIRGLYRGFNVSCTCIFIYRGLYFGLYDSIKPILLTEDSPLFHTFLLGWIVTITAGLAAYPIDTIKRRMMLTAGQQNKYSSSIDCLRQVIATEGKNALYKGAGVNIVRGMAGAGVLVGFDKLKKFHLSRRKKDVL